MSLDAELKNVAALFPQPLTPERSMQPARILSGREYDAQRVWKSRRPPSAGFTVLIPEHRWHSYGAPYIHKPHLKLNLPAVLL